MYLAKWHAADLFSNTSSWKLIRKLCLLIGSYGWFFTSFYWRGPWLVYLCNINQAHCWIMHQWPWPNDYCTLAAMSWIVICRPLPSEKISGLPQSIVESASGIIGSRCITINRLKAWSALKYLLLWGFGGIIPLGLCGKSSTWLTCWHMILVPVNAALSRM